MGYQVIDLKKWNRAVHCEIFRNYIEPQYGISFELDITNFIKEVKAKKYSFTLAMVYTVAKGANEIEAFRYRFQGGEVVLFDQIQTAFTYLNPETELFKVVKVPMQESLKDYVKLASKLAKEQKEYFTGPLGNDVFQFSAMPWISFTYISHTHSGQKEQATPLFDWGKYFERAGHIILPFSIQAHHSFVDGLHMGQLAEHLQADLNKPLD